MRDKKRIYLRSYEYLHTNGLELLHHFPYCSTLLHIVPPANVLIDQNLRAGSALGARTTCRVRTRLIDERLL